MIGVDRSSAASASAHLSRRDFLVAGGLATTALVPALLTRQRGPSQNSAQPALESLLPDMVGGWRRSPSDGLLIPRGEQSEDEDEAYDEVATRFYTSAVAAPIMLLIAYGSAQTHRTQLHRPEVCYPASGFKLHAWPDLPLRLPGGASIMARVLTATAPGRIEQILYWSRVGRQYPTSNLAQRWSVFRQTFEGSIPDGALVRMSTIDPDQPKALRALARFAGDLDASSDPTLRRLMTAIG